MLIEFSSINCFTAYFFWKPKHRFRLAISIDSVIDYCLLFFEAASTTFSLVLLPFLFLFLVIWDFKCFLCRLLKSHGFISSFCNRMLAFIVDWLTQFVCWFGLDWRACRCGCWVVSVRFNSSSIFWIILIHFPNSKTTTEEFRPLKPCSHILQSSPLWFHLSLAHCQTSWPLLDGGRFL